MIQFNLKTLIAIVLAAAIGLAVYDRFFPFNSLCQGSVCSVSDAASYRGIDRFRVDLEGAFVGTLECEFIDPRVTYPPAAKRFNLNSAFVNAVSHISQSDARLELCDFSHKNETYGYATTLVEKLPSLEELKSFQTFQQYIDHWGSRVNIPAASANSGVFSKSLMTTRSK